MAVPKFQEALLHAFPEPTWFSMVRGLREGISLADDVIRNTPMLNTTVGRDIRGHLRRVGVLYRFQQLCQIGDLPFTARESEMPFGVWHWLDIRTDQFLAHVVRTECMGAMPSETANRQVQCVRNQYDLLSEGRVLSMAEVFAKVSEFYAFLTFGTDRSGALTHACMGMPSSDNSEWLAHVNLMRHRDSGADRESLSPAPKSPDPKDRMRFRDHVEQALAGKQKAPGDKSA